MAAIRCPHCEETGCDGRCRFLVGRRGFIGLALGAIAAAMAPSLPASPLGNYTEIIVGPFGYTSPDALGPLYAGRLIYDMDKEILLYKPSANPLVVLTERMRENRAAVKMGFDWLNKPTYPRRLTR